MRKILSIVLVSLISTSFCFSQIFVGGSFNITTTGGSEKTNNVSTDKESTFNLNLNPQVGYFLNPNLAVGTYLVMGLYRKNDNKNPETITTTTTFGLAPFARYYFMEIGQLSLFGEGNIGFSSSKTKFKSNGVSVDGNKTTNFGINVLPGVAYKISEKIEIEAFIGGLSFSTENSNLNNNEDKSNSLSLGLSTNLNIGFIYKF